MDTVTIQIANLAVATGPAGEPEITGRMVLLILQLGAIFVLARLSNILFERLKIPGVLGELTLGILIGPYLLGTISLPGFPEGFFPFVEGFPVSPELYAIASLAAVILLFNIGLETDFRLFLRYSVAGGLVGLTGLLASFSLAILVTVVFSEQVFGRPLGPSSPEVLLLGVVSIATSVGITARTLSEHRSLDKPEGVTILAGAVVDDVGGIIILAVVLAVAGAAAVEVIDWGRVTAIALRTLGIWLVATAAGLLAAQRIGFFLKAFRSRVSIAIVALGMALLVAGLFEEAGLAMIIGAYAMGLSLSRTDLAHVVKEKVDTFVDFLVPVFFVVMGMLVDLTVLASAPVLLFGLLFTVVAIAAKAFGSAVPPLLLGFNSLGAIRIGMGMVPRGEVALIIASIGLAQGILGPEGFGVAVMTTLLTTMVAPLALSALLRIDRSGLKREKPTETTTVSFTFPSLDTANLLTGRLVGEFEREGYFVHLLNHEQQIYQLRKDGIVIGMTQELTELRFEAEPADIAFINTAVVEVVADLERTIRQLQKPIDTERLMRRLQAKEATYATRFDLRAFLGPELVKSELVGTTKEEIITELLGILRRAGLLDDVSEAQRVVLEREASMSTGLEHGVAIPHGRTDKVDGLVCAVGRKLEGVEFGALDGQPSRIFVLSLAPPTGTRPHVQFIAHISQVLDEAGRQRVLGAQTSEEIYRVLVGAE